ncbi:MAG: 3-isopropylmalate dehydratase small subunit [Acidobacteriia bacterium]|nr:3-isopropylmalate dehydratase small subunit [Terriglobia bacterium]
MTGRAHVYARPHINTDEIIPARYLNVHEEAELAKHAMEDIDADFVKRVKPGDFLVVAEDFGCGSSREHAVWALRGAQVAGVIATSFARIFYRNAINNGFLAIECEGFCGETSPGDEIEVNIGTGTITNLSKRKVYLFTPIPDFAREMMQVGGLLEYVRRKIERDKNKSHSA